MEWNAVILNSALVYAIVLHVARLLSTVVLIHLLLYNLV